MNDVTAAARDVLASLTYLRVVDRREPHSGDEGQARDLNAWHRWHTERKLAHQAWSSAVLRLATAVNTESKPRIEIVTYRDPDGPTYLRLFIDGQPADDQAEWTDIDPGAGHVLREWREARDNAVNTASHDAAELIQELYDDGEATGHIDRGGYHNPHDDVGVS